MLFHVSTPLVHVDGRRSALNVLPQYTFASSRILLLGQMYECSIRPLLNPADHPSFRDFPSFVVLPPDTDDAGLVHGRRFCAG